MSCQKHNLATLDAARIGRNSSRKRVFYLGFHSYSGGPGCCWNTSYWVKNIKKGKLWELYLSAEDSSNYRSRLYNGTYTVEELRDYFESVDFELAEDEWRDMGLGMAADVLFVDSVNLAAR